MKSLASSSSVLKGRHLVAPSNLPCKGVSPKVRVPPTQALPEILSSVVSINDIPTPIIDLIQHMPLAYERVVLPCSSMNCGDVTYRSTLDPALRGELRGIDWKAFALAAPLLAYLSARPGVLQGFWDSYFAQPIQRSISKAVDKEDIILGRRLATGGFGTVYRAELKDGSGATVPVIVKKAKEFGEAEVWMNERMMRAAPDSCAGFIAAFDERSPSVGSPLDDAVWLMWKYEGQYTLFDLMQKREFPYNLEPLLFDRELRLPKGNRRKLACTRLVMQQLLESLSSCHSVGIVHRDIKPQNAIVSESTKRLKLIDLGAAADLRVGINYVPNEYLLDPRYAPPQQYIMSTQTPRAPPVKAVAALLSPVLWALNKPDRFDMYSVGVVLVQLVFSPLRNDNALVAFNRKLEQLEWDLEAWRKEEEKKRSREMLDGFEMLDLDDRAGWDLLKELLSFNPEERPSATDALAHRFFNPELSKVVSAVTLGPLTKAGTSILGGIAGDLEGSRREVPLTEAQIAAELGIKNEEPPKAMKGSATIAWWQNRREDVQKRVRERRNKFEVSEKKAEDKAKSVPGLDKAMANIRGR